MSDQPIPFNNYQMSWLQRELGILHDRIDAALGLTPAPVAPVEEGDGAPAEVPLVADNPDAQALLDAIPEIPPMPDPEAGPGA